MRIEWADREKGVEKKVEPQVTSPKGVNPFASHGKLFEQGKADMYNACEWGNYCRVQDTGTGSRQLGRRAIVAYSALVVAPDSPVFTPQQLANKTIGVPFYFGTHYIALHMLEGFLPRDMIKLCRAPNGSRYRLDALMRGEIDATTLDRAAYHACREERLPHHLLGLLPRHRGRLRPGGCGNLCRVQSRGARGGAPDQRQQARLPALFHRLLRQERIRRSPRSRWKICARAGSSSAIPRRSRLDEMQRTYDWLKSWGMLEETASPLQLVNTEVQSHAHQAAE